MRDLLLTVRKLSEEFLALSSIYPEIEGDVNGPWTIPIGVGSASLEVHTPLDYPSAACPTPVLYAEFISDDRRAALALSDARAVAATAQEDIRPQTSVNFR